MSDNRPETIEELAIQCAGLGSTCVGRDGAFHVKKATQGTEKIVAEYMGRKEVGIKSFRDGLESLINSESMENGSNTPDFILASYMSACLMAFDAATKARDSWYSIAPSPGHGHDHA